jgi:hypothetical protein
MTKPIQFLHTICSFSGWSCLVYQPAWNVLSSAMKIERVRGQTHQKKKKNTWQSSKKCILSEIFEIM